jgi:hypothetical protein
MDTDDTEFPQPFAIKAIYIARPYFTCRFISLDLVCLGGLLKEAEIEMGWAQQNTLQFEHRVPLLHRIRGPT